MNTASIVRPPSRKQLIISAGRAHLRTWLLAAEAHGTIYYNVQSVSRSGMNRKISLSTIMPTRIGDDQIYKTLMKRRRLFARAADPGRRGGH